MLNRPLCSGTASGQVNPCQSSAYVTYFYDSYDNSSNAGVTFPSGCTIAGGTSFSIGETVAETFSNTTGSGWRCAGFDARGETTTSMLSVTASSQTTTQTVLQSYNDVGEPTTLTYPDGEIVTSSYDNNGYFRGMTTANGAIVSDVRYTNAGQLAGMTIGGVAYQGTVTTPVTMSMGYDGIGRPNSTGVSVNGTTLFNQTQTYDNVGNVLELSTTLPSGSGGSLTDNQSFCYDALDRLTWAGNSGTPAGGDHCGSTPVASTTPTYSQLFNYDVLDRMTSGAAGTVTYGDASHVHAATGLSTVPTQYASYDAMGNMTCRNTDTSGSQSCASGAQTGATMSYDNEGQLTSWTAPSGTTGSQQNLYDGEGNRVLQSQSSSSGTSTVITFDGWTDTTISNGTTTTTKYYHAGGQTVAEATGTAWYALVPDLLGSAVLAVRSDGSVQAMQLYAPYGASRYSVGTMPTAYNFTGQRLDALTGLLYYNARYYDAVSGRFTSADPVLNNTSGMDPYAYVGDNPTSATDPTGLMVIGPGGGGIDCLGIECEPVVNDVVGPQITDGLGGDTPMWNLGDPLGNDVQTPSVEDQLGNDLQGLEKDVFNVMQQTAEEAWWQNFEKELEKGFLTALGQSGSGAASSDQPPSSTPPASSTDMGWQSKALQYLSGRSAAAVSNVTDSNGEPAHELSGKPGVTTIGDLPAKNNFFGGQCAETRLCAAIAEGLRNGTMQLPPGNEPIIIVESQKSGLFPCDACRRNGGVLQSFLSSIGIERDVIFYNAKDTPNGLRLYGPYPSR